MDVPNPCIPSSIAIFSARESAARLMTTVKTAIQAAVDSCVIDVVVNGNRALADEFAQSLNSLKPACEAKGADLRIWFVTCGDKAHAWNTYLHEIWPESEVAFFVDGYVSLWPDACSLLGGALLAKKDVSAGTGVPTCGRTAARLRAQMLREGGIHGNFYAIKRDTMRLLRQRGYRLPLGIYRTDPTLAAAINFKLDPAENTWDPTQILVHPDVSWNTDPRAWWRLAELKSQYKRMLRQGQGRLENVAVRDHLAVRRQSPETMPSTAAELVLDWCARNPAAAKRMARFSYPVRHALHELSAPRDWSAKDKPAELFASLRCGS